ncbi:MAG: hypothetical protein AAFN70_19885, partial [Planctomycetota bacterium]
LVVRTTGTPTADIRIRRSGSTQNLDVDLDAGSPSTLRDVADQIAATADVTPGFGSGQFRVHFSESDQTIYLVDLAKGGSVSTFTVSNLNGSHAATDLGLDGAAASEREVIFESSGDEFAIEFSSSNRVLGGNPLHGDSAAAHLRFAESTTPTIAFGFGVSANGVTGSARHGIVDVQLSDITIDPTSRVDAALTLQPSTLDRVWKGLDDPFPFLKNGAVSFDFPLDVDMHVTPRPAIDGVSVTQMADYAYMASNLYDVRAGVETVTPTIGGDVDVRTLLESTQSLTIEDLFESLEGVTRYLVTVQNQTSLTDNIPGLSTSIGNLLDFSGAFRGHIDRLRDAPSSVLPQSIQDLNVQLNDTIDG